jgi:hypothetical protein
MAAPYKYAVRLRGEVVAYTTTKREAEQEARAVGGTYGPVESVPAQYVEGFEGKAFGRRVAEIQRERERGSYEPLPSDKGVVTQRSKWSEKFERAFGRKPYDVRDVSDLTGIPKKVLQEVYDRGLAAWSTGGHRPGASQHGWAMARVQSFVLGGPTSKGPDRDLAAKANPRDASTRFRTLDRTGLGLVLQQDADNPDSALLLLIDPHAEWNERAVVGMLELDRHTDQCWRAWEVMASAVDERYAGKGLGMAMYLAAQVLLDAPIVSDRHSVSDSAQLVWNRIYEDSVDFKRKPLDNVLAPKTPPRIDDCRVHGDPALDHAYKLSPEVRDAIAPIVEKLLRRGAAIEQDQASARGRRVESVRSRWSRQATELFEEAMKNRSSRLVDLKVSEEDLSELHRLLGL